MGRYLKIITCFLLVIMISMSNLQWSTSAMETAEWREIPSKSTADVNKVWTVSFSSEVDETTVIQNENVYVLNEKGEKVQIQTNVEGEKIKVTPVASYEQGQSYTLFLMSSLQSKEKQSLVKNTKFTFNLTTADGTTTITEKGTYGGTLASPKTYIGNVVIDSEQVTLQHAIIKGKLIISDKVREGEVTISNVKVEGDTEVRGGGPNSVYFKDTVLMTVIVNKNNGSIRIVAEGSTTVKEVLLESAAILEEIATSDRAGFSHVEVTEGVRNSVGDVKLIGTFDTVNVRATNVQITLSESTTLDELVLSAMATVRGAGLINRLNVTSSGNNSTVEQRPQSVVLDISGHVSIAGEVVSESYSDVEQTSIRAIEATMSYTRVDLAEQKVDLTKDDFTVSAKLNGQPTTLQNLRYLPNLQLFTYDPLPLSNANIGQEVVITVAPNTNSNKVVGSAVTDRYHLETGFSGRITDIFGKGAANMSIILEDGYNRAVTDRNGYYSLDVFPGTHYGTVSGPGFVKTNIVGTVASHSFTTGVNETAIRAAATNEMKIMLSWNDKERDVDSHLATKDFHIAYYNKTYGEEINGKYVEYVDLDWDDVDYFGPETTTIRKWKDGRYIFFLHNFSGEYPLHDSESKVEVFLGNAQAPNYTFNVPTDTKDARYWGVFEIFVSNNGQSIEVKELNMIADDEEWLIDPYGSLGNYIKHGEEMIRQTTDQVVINQVQERLISAKQLLTKPSATTKQLVTQIQELAEIVKIRYSYNDGPLHLYELDNYGTLEINAPLLIDGFIKDEAYSPIENNETVKLEVSIWSYDYDYDYDYKRVGNQHFNWKTKRTGEVKRYETNSFESTVLFEGSYSDLLSQFEQGFSLETQFQSSGYYDLVISLTVGESDYPSHTLYVPFSVW